MVYYSITILKSDINNIKIGWKSTPTIMKNHVPLQQKAFHFNSTVHGFFFYHIYTMMNNVFIITSLTDSASSFAASKKLFVK